MQIQMNKKLMILSGAGLSAESGIPTFRDADNGLWKDFDPMVLANWNTWRANFAQVHEFYNQRRTMLRDIKPNAAHFKVAEWQNKYQAQVFTTNIDLLLEAAGCRNVIHVHGRLDQMQCTSCFHEWGVGYEPYDTALGCPVCACVRDVKPNVVFFGEIAPRYAAMYDCIDQINKAVQDGMFVSIGTSGTVIQVDEISQFLDCPTVLNVLNLDRDSDGYYPPLSPRHWTHCFIGPATEKVHDIDKVLAEWYAK